MDIFEDDEAEEVHDASSDLIGASDDKNSLQYRKDSSQLQAEITRKSDLEQKRASAIVTSGALTFILLAAALVTTSFLMSPVIEQIFGKAAYSRTTI